MKSIVAAVSTAGMLLLTPHLADAQMMKRDGAGEQALAKLCADRSQLSKEDLARCAARDKEIQMKRDAEQDSTKK